MYDTEGICGFWLWCMNFFYIKDGLGNVRSIVTDASSEQNDVSELKEVANYTYDAWGNCTINPVPDGIVSEVNIAEFNKIRWKSMYYDSESGLYYINGRYYSPDLRRFIQPAEVASLNPLSVNGLNLYNYTNSNPISIAYSGSGVGISSIGSSINKGNFCYYGFVSNSSNILGALGAISSTFGYFDQWSGFLNGGLDAGLEYWGPKGFGFQSLDKYSSSLKKFGIGMAIAGNVLSWGSSVYNNFTNLNYSIGEAFGASAMDAAYYTGKGLGTYWLGSNVGKLAVTAGTIVGSATLGTTIFGTTIGFVGALAIGGGVAVLVGIAGAVAIYYLGEWIDNEWERFKKQIFE